MAPNALRQCTRATTLYLIFLIATTTLGPLQFGFHLAELNAPQQILTCAKPSPSTSSTSLLHSLKNKVTTTSVSSSLILASAGPTLPLCIPMPPSLYALVSSIFTLGGLLGALCASPLCTTYGRVKPLRLTTLFFTLGSLLEASALNVPMLAIGRMMSGIGAGAALVIVPLYIAEVAPPKQRGLWGVMTQVSINLGLLITQTLGYFWDRGMQWRYILAVGTVHGVLQAIGLVFVPETPTWLATQGQVEKALNLLRRIRARGSDIGDEVAAWGVDIDGADVTAETEGLLSSGAAIDGSASPRITNSRSPTRRASAGSGKASSKSSSHSYGDQGVGFLSALKDSTTRPAIVAVVGVMFAQQLTGINSVMMYSVSILSPSFPSSAALITILLSLLNLVMTIAASPLPDALGRKVCLLGSIAGMGISSTALAVAMSTGVNWLAVTAVFTFVGSFALGLGPIPFMLASELVPPSARGATQSWALAANWTFTFVVAQFFPIVNDALGGNGEAFYGFAGLAMVSACFVWWRVPETRGKRDADEVWGRERRID